MNICSGVLFLHAIPKATANELDAIFARLKIKTQSHVWQLQPLVLGAVSTTVDFRGPQGSCESLVADLAQLPAIRFEVIQQPLTGQIGHRWAFSPGLGIFSSATDQLGNTLVNEVQLQSVLYGSGNNLLKTQAAIRKLLGTAWEDDLERFRAQSYETVLPYRLAGFG